MGALARIINKLYDIRTERKFTPLDAGVNWTRIETLVHGPGAGDSSTDGGDFNSAVFSCLMALSLAYVEPPLRVYNDNQDGNSEHLPNHPWQTLLNNPTPNGELSPRELWFWIAWAKHSDGNAYLLKVRSGDETRGNVVQLWPVSPSVIEPVTEKNSGDWISYYRHYYEPNRYKDIPVENIIHFRLGIDPLDLRRGLSPLKRLVRSIATDTEADKFTDALLKNFAVPGLVVATKDPNLKEEEANLIKEAVSRNFGSDNRGNVAVLSNGADVKQFGFSPEQLNLAALHRIPEERISAVMGIPAILAGLGAGLDAATYSNAETLRALFTETRLIPSWNMDAEKITVAMHQDLPSQRGVSVRFDISDVRALQEDEDAKYNRLNLAMEGETPWIRVNEARADVGLPPDDELEALQIARAERGANPPPPPPQFGQENDQEESDQEADEGEDEEPKAFAFLENKANRALLRAFPEMLPLMVELAQPGMERDVDRYLAGLQKRVNGKVRDLA